MTLAIRGLVALLLVLGTVSPARAGDRFSVEVSLQRNELQAQRLDLQRELKDLDRSIREAEQPVWVSGTVQRAEVVHRMRSDDLERLRTQRQRLLDRIGGVDRRFDALTRRVVAHYDERPPWWNDIDR